MTPSELSDSMFQDYQSSQKGRYIFQMSDKFGLEVFFDSSAYRVSDQTYSNGNWDNSQSFPLRRRNYLLEKALSECLIPDLIANKKQKISSQAPMLRSFKVVVADYSQCKSDYLAKFPKDKSLIKSLEALANELEEIERKASKLEGAVAIATHRRHTLSVAMGDDFLDPRQKEQFEEAYHNANDVVTTSDTLSNQLEMNRETLVNRKKTLVAKVKSVQMKNACLELPEKGTASGNTIAQLQLQVNQSSKDDPIRYYAMLDQAAHLKSESERSAHLRRTLDACIAQFVNSEPNQIHLATVIYRGIRNNPGWLSKTRKQYLSVGVPAAEKAIHQHLQKGISPESLANAHRVYGELNMMNLRVQGLLRREREVVESRAQFHLDQAQSLLK